MSGMTKEQIVSEIQKWSSDTGKNPSELLASFEDNSNSSQGAKDERSTVDPTSLPIMKLLAVQGSLINQQLSGVSQEEADFNDLARRKALSIKESDSSEFQKFLARDIRQRTQSCVVSGATRPISRPQGDSVLETLTLMYPTIAENVELSSDLKVYRKRIVKLLEKGRFKPIHRSKSQNYLDAKARGFLLDIEQTLSKVLEIFYDDLRPTYDEELDVMQTCIKLLHNTNKMLNLTHDENLWNELDFNAKVEMITDLELKFPFVKGGGAFGKAFHPKANSGALKKAVKRCLFYDAKSKGTKRKRIPDTLKSEFSRFHKKVSKEEAKAIVDGSPSEALKKKLAGLYGLDFKHKTSKGPG